MVTSAKDNKPQLYFIATIVLILLTSSIVYLSLLYRIQDTEKRAFESIHELRVENEKLRSEN